METRSVAEIGYELLDSGAGRKLERFGTRILDRPSSLCLWKKRRPASWKEASARFDPDSGWSPAGLVAEPWSVEIAGAKLELRLQTNGQVGLFPEHASYLPDAVADLRRLEGLLGRRPRALNLFAYTGMATVVLASGGADVVHVEISKAALGWAKRSMELNGLGESDGTPGDAGGRGDPSGREERPGQIKGGVRLIPDDAVEFLEREVRRGNRYDLVIADPPAFSRISKSKSWKLEETATRLSELLAAVCEPSSGCLYLTAHDMALGPQVFSNLILDCAPQDDGDFEFRQLSIPEPSSGRAIPAGYLMIWRRVWHARY